ncbi:monocarboxylate transporter 13-like [Hyalella azteca]|uniref:Monocarboxylate transporter 13-like n=1 Tax=Hyalella azteca TaxID=294128 RepID=A0A979FR19_HYAAZ|nr:monocarboxylate transporter 13-like [Hyalella azteca]
MIYPASEIAANSPDSKICHKKFSNKAFKALVSSRGYGTNDDENKLYKGSSWQQSLLDGKWSWVALMMAFYIQVIVGFLSSCFGVFFSEKMASFSASSSLSSGIFTLHIFFFDLGSLICPDIASKLGHRSTTFAALVTAFFSFVLLALCDGLGVIFVSYGIVLALSGGFLYNVTLLIVPMYFEKYRRPALSCITVAMCASGAISPHLVRYLIDFYGYSGGLLLYGACFLQACVLVVLFSAQCLGNSAMMGTLVRIVVTLTVNHQRFPRKAALCVASIIAGVLDIGFIFSHGDEHVLTALSVVHGLGVGMFSSIFYAILIDIVGLELYPQCLAVLAIVLLVTDTSMSPILGVIRDFSGSYSAVLSTCAALKFSAAILLVILFVRMKKSLNSNN